VIVATGVEFTADTSVPVRRNSGMLFHQKSNKKINFKTTSPFLKTCLYTNTKKFSHLE
jgi:hypothetical protein